MLGIVAAVGIALALLVQGLSEAVAGVAGLIGIVALIGAVAMGAQARGRVGPAQPHQASCCGCSCIVALVALPAAGAVLWMHGGPAMAALALPAWIPLSWAIHAGERLVANSRFRAAAANPRCDRTTTRGSQENRMTADR